MARKKAKGSDKDYWMYKGGKTIVKHPGSLRATARRMGLLKGDENLSQEDLRIMKKRGGPKTRKRVALAKVYKSSRKVGRKKKGS